MGIRWRPMTDKLLLFTYMLGNWYKFPKWQMHSGRWIPHARTNALALSSCDYECEIQQKPLPLQWRHNERDIVSNHQPHDCLLSRLFGCRSKKTSTLRVTGHCAGNSPGTGEFPAQMVSNAEMFPFDDIIMRNYRAPRMRDLSTNVHPFE